MLEISFRTISQKIEILKISFLTIERKKNLLETRSKASNKKEKTFE
jgi:hypothetical protein